MAAHFELGDVNDEIAVCVHQILNGNLVESNGHCQPPHLLIRDAQAQRIDASEEDVGGDFAFDDWSKVLPLLLDIEEQNSDHYADNHQPCEEKRASDAVVSHIRPIRGGFLKRTPESLVCQRFQVMEELIDIPVDSGIGDALAQLLVEDEGHRGVADLVLPEGLFVRV